MRSSSFVAGLLVMLIAGGLFGADFLLKERPYALGSSDTEEPLDETEVPSSPSGTVQSSSDGESTSSSRSVVKKGVSTKKKAGIDVQSVLNNLQLIVQQTNESGFLTFIATGDTVAQTSVLLRNNDRAFLFSWIDSNDSKSLFSSLKQALSEQFSGKMTDLVDETRMQENGPPVDVLSFFDSTLSPEKILFLRVRTRLYEIHIAENGEEVLDALVKQLSQ